MNELRPIDFLASEMYQADAQAKNSIGVRWLCLREDVAVKYLRKAQKAYEAWAADERRAEKLREAGSPRAFFGSARETTGDANAK